MPFLIPNPNITLAVYLLMAGVVKVSISSIINQHLDSINTHHHHLLEKANFNTTTTTTTTEDVSEQQQQQHLSPSESSSEAHHMTEIIIDSERELMKPLCFATSAMPNQLDDQSFLHLRNGISCLVIVLLYNLLQRVMLGRLRASEQQHTKEAFWDYFIQKIFFIIFFDKATKPTANHGEHFNIEADAGWFVWFFGLGAILLLTKLCKDRFEYLTSSPATKKWSITKICLLMTGLFLISLYCCFLPFTGQHSSTQTLLLFTDAAYILTFVVSVITKFLIIAYDMRTNSIWENRATIVYYVDLFYEMLMSTIDLLHQSHLILTRCWFWLIKVHPLLRIHTLITEMRYRYKKHINYLLVVNLMENNFTLASSEELNKNSDDCAICWDSMESARKLPCGHLFHHSCLRSWLEQDTSCPICRTSLKAPDEIQDQLETEEFIETIQSTQQRNHLFHFDTSRYTNNQFLGWLPTISIEGFM